MRTLCTYNVKKLQSTNNMSFITVITTSLTHGGGKRGVDPVPVCIFDACA